MILTPPQIVWEFLLLIVQSHTLLGPRLYTNYYIFVKLLSKQAFGPWTLTSKISSSFIEKGNKNETSVPVLLYVTGFEFRIIHKHYCYSS